MNKRDRRMLKRIAKMMKSTKFQIEYIESDEPEPEYSQYDKSFAEYMEELAKTYGVV